MRKIVKEFYRHIRAKIKGYFYELWKRYLKKNIFSYINAGCFMENLTNS